MGKLKLSFLQSELSRVSEWIQFSDKKSAFLSVYYSGIFFLLISYKKSIISSFSNFNRWELCLYTLLILITTVVFIVGIFFLIRSVFPRLRNTNTDKSLFYFGSIANLKLINYSKGVEKLTEEEAKKQILEQIYTNSIIAKQKMNNVKNSTWCLFILMIFVSILLII